MQTTIGVKPGVGFMNQNTFRFLKVYHRGNNARIAGSPQAKAEFRIQEKRQKRQRWRVVEAERKCPSWCTWSLGGNIFVIFKISHQGHQGHQENLRVKA